MSRIFLIRITGGTSPGPYTIYCNLPMNDSNIATISGTTDLAQDLELTELTPPNGVVVECPNDSNVIYLYNQFCGEQSEPCDVSPFMCFTYRGFGAGEYSTFSCTVRAGDTLLNGKRWWNLSNCPVNSTFNSFFTCPRDVGFVWWDNTTTPNRWRYTDILGSVGPGGDYAYLEYQGDYPVVFYPFRWVNLDGTTCFPEMIDSYSGPCVSENPQPLIPPVRIIYKDFCLSYYPSDSPNNKKSYHFIPSNELDSNGNPTWYWESNTNSKVVWNSTISQWGITNFLIENGTLYSTSDITSNPPLNWQPNGTNFPITVLSVIGNCQTSNRSSFPVSINQPTCFCDGSILFNVNLDNPPFSYSIDNGVTYSSSPIFNNLCSGIYVLSVVDSSGNTFSKTVTLDEPSVSTTYTLSLTTTTSTPVSNEISLVKNYETTINVSPELPDGTSITFDLIHTNSFYSSPTSGTSILTTGTVLNKNFSSLTVNSIVTGNTQSVNTTPGCQNQNIYQSDINEQWNSITITNTDTVTLSTTSRVDKTTTGLCVVGYSNDTYSIVNASISGCDCCTLIVNT